MTASPRHQPSIPPPREAPGLPEMSTASAPLRSSFLRALEERLQEAAQGRLRLQVAPAARLLERHEGFQYRFRPEVHLQVAGESEYRWPGGGFAAAAGWITLLPPGLPFAHLGRAGADGPFEAFALAFYTHSLGVHALGADGAGRAAASSLSFQPSPDLRHVSDLVDALLRAWRLPEPCRAPALQGLGQALCALTTHLLRQPPPELRRDSHRIYQAKWIIREQLQNPELTVKLLAKRLGCSADYLSFLFHKETGETLIHYINRQRIDGASEALTGTTLTISEIAWACGFGDAGYFARVFRKFTGQTPNAFRRERVGGLRQEEGGEP